MIIPVDVSRWSYLYIFMGVSENGGPSKMAVLGKMMMNYIKIGYGSRFSLLKWSDPERPGHWDREDCGRGDVFSVRVRWVLIDLVVQWGDYLKKNLDWWFQCFLSFINGMIFWVDLYLVAEWRRSLIRVGPMAVVGDLRWEGVAKAVRRYAGWCGAPSLSGSAHKLRATNGVVDLWYSRTMESGNYHVATWVSSLESF
jgi:hypothetical protein